MPDTRARRPSKLTTEARGRRRPAFPAHLQSTPEEWRALKRQEWREVMAALERFDFGSAYVPMSAERYKLRQLAWQIQDAVMAEGWVAW